MIAMRGAADSVTNILVISGHTPKVLDAANEKNIEGELFTNIYPNSCLKPDMRIDNCASNHSYPKYQRISNYPTQMDAIAFL
jgi:hypothetical protein